MSERSADNAQVSQFTITPKVDEVREFIEIANDFTNPLELVDATV